MSRLPPRYRVGDLTTKARKYAWGRKGHLLGAYVDHMTEKQFFTFKYKIKQIAIIVIANQKHGVNTKQNISWLA